MIEIFCLDANLNYHAIFVKSIIQILFLIVYLIMASFFWIIHFFCSKKKNLIGNLISTFIILLETYNSGLLIQLTNSLNCEKLNNSYYLAKDFRVSCQTDEYFFWVITFFKIFGTIKVIFPNIFYRRKILEYLYLFFSVLFLQFYIWWPSSTIKMN